MKEIILDTETTGLDPKQGHRIVEIGALEMRNKVLTGNKFHFYINPERDMPTEAYRIHGISGEFLKDKPIFGEIAEEFLIFIQGGRLVIHNAQFDVKFLNHELSLVNKPSIELEYTIDTLVMARKRFPGMKLNLDALCKKFKIDNSGRKFHGALLDAALLADVYVELTGGRQEIFNFANNHKESTNTSTTGKNSSNIKRTVTTMKPSAEEIQKHKEFLAKISNPIWLR